MPELVCVAPAEFWAVIRQGMMSLGIKVRFFKRLDARQSDRASSKDPYDLQSLVSRLRKRADGLLLVAPRCRSPRSVAPAPLIDGIPLGLVFANSPEDLLPWLDSMYISFDAEPLWAVTAMWKRSYMNLGKKFFRWMKGSGVHVEAWYADNVTREELSQKLTVGPKVLLYVGHGRPRGLTGYRGLRWRHFAEHDDMQPCGTFICFACSTLRRSHGVYPFGCQLVSRGITSAYFGAVEPLYVDANTRLAHEMGALFENNETPDLGTMVKKLDRRLRDSAQNEPVYRAFMDYRIIGNPVQPLT